MKILFCIDSMTSGGAERVIANLSNYLVKQNNDVTILTLLNRESSYELDKKVKYDSLKIREGKKNIYQKIKSIFENRSKYLKYLKENKHDIVISFLPRASYYSAMVCKKSKTKLIISERNDPESIYNTLLKKIFTKYLYNKADGFVFQTKMASEYFSKKIQKKSIIIPNPVNDKFLIKPYSGERKKEIVSVGRLTEQKNQILLIEAFKIINEKYSDYKLVIYGDGPLRLELEEKIKEYNLTDKIKLPGISKDILNNIYDSSMFILSSNYEGMPNALMESLALGIPSISTDCPCGGPKELIVNNKDGLLIPVNDLKSLVNAIETLINNEDMCQEFSKNSNKKMKAYNVSEINKKWISFIKKIVKE